jgi:hypothetical protein
VDIGKKREKENKSWGRERWQRGKVNKAAGWKGSSDYVLSHRNNLGTLNM